jgi:hypothetical protein
MKLLVGAYFWKPDAGSKFEAPYTSGDIVRLAEQVERHCTVPHEFIVVTDQPEKFGHPNLPHVRPIPLDRATHVDGTCYARLMTFHPNGKEMFGGDAFLQIDVDTLIVGNIDHLCRRKENLVLWRNPARVPWEPLQGMPPGASGMTDRGENGQRKWLINQARCFYNTSILFHRLGSMPDVWENFVGRRAEGYALPAKDDQWLLSNKFGINCPYFDGARDGVYRLARADTPGSGVDGTLPENACIVTFPGSHGKPSDPAIRAANPWIEQHVSGDFGGWAQK